MRTCLRRRFPFESEGTILSARWPPDRWPGKRWLTSLRLHPCVTVVRMSICVRRRYLLEGERVTVSVRWESIDCSIDGRAAGAHHVRASWQPPDSLDRMIDYAVPASSEFTPFFAEMGRSVLCGSKVTESRENVRSRWPVTYKLA